MHCHSWSRCFRRAGESRAMSDAMSDVVSQFGSENAEPLRLEELDTPCLLLDETRMTRNIERLRARLGAQQVQLRPHLKTPKSIEVARRTMDTNAGPAAVSTLKEAEQFADAGVLDLLYA